MVEDNSQPFVSIVIPVLNCAADVDECIQALRGQNYPQDRYEIIVVDNGSTDDTVERLRAAGIEPVHRSERGRSKALNAGLELARGEIICSTDISCRPERNWIAEIVRSFEDAAVGCVAGEIKALKPGDNAAVRFQERHDYMSPMAARKRLNPPFLPYADGANASFRRELFEMIGPFEESFFKGADVEICYRMFFLTDFKMVFNPRAVVWEPCEADFGALLHQRFRIGVSNILFRRRFPGLFQNKKGLSLRGMYWWLRSRMNIKDSMIGLWVLAAVGKKDREIALDASIRWLMGISQGLGRWYGRWLLRRSEIRPTPLHRASIRDYRSGKLDITPRVVFMPEAPVSP